MDDLEAVKRCLSNAADAHSAVTQWARDVFSGEVAFDPDAETAWRDKLERIRSEALELWRMNRTEVPRYETAGRAGLPAALWELSQLLDNWVTPKLSIAPSARVRPSLSDEELAAMRKQLADLPPLVR